MKIKHLLFFFFILVSIFVHGEESISPFVLYPQTNLVEKVMVSTPDTPLLNKTGKVISQIASRQIFYVLKSEKGIEADGDYICIGNNEGEEIGWIERKATISIPCFLVIHPDSNKGLPLFNSPKLEGESILFSKNNFANRLNFVIPSKQEGLTKPFIEILSVPLEDSAAELKKIASVSDSHSEMPDTTNSPTVSKQTTNVILSNSSSEYSLKDPLKILHGYLPLNDTQVESFSWAKENLVGRYFSPPEDGSEGLFSWGIFICRSEFKAYKLALASEYASLNEYTASGNGNLRRITYNIQDIFGSMIDGTPVTNPKTYQISEISCPAIQFIFKELPSLKKKDADYSVRLKTAMAAIKAWAIQMIQTDKDDTKWSHFPDGKEFTIFTLKKSEKK